MRRNKLFCHFIFIILIYLGVVTTAVAESNKAYVHFGAVLLGQEPQGNRTRRDRVGYLPIGTIVYFNDTNKLKKIFNYNAQKYEYYVYVRSNTGFSGYIKRDLISVLDERELLITLRYTINIREINSDKVLLKVSCASTKTSSTPLEVIGEQGDYYTVRVYPENDSVGPFQVGRLFKPMVDGKHLVRLSKHLHNAPPVIYRSSPSEFTQKYLEKFSTLMSQKTGETTKKIVSFIASLNALRCRISSSADVKLGANIFGTGLGLSFKFVLAEKNAIYSMKTVMYRKGSEHLSEYYQLHDIHCHDGIPNRLENLILVRKFDPSQQIIISQKGLPEKLRNNWARFETKKSEKMINIDGFPAYESFMTHLSQSEHLRDLPAYDRLILSHMLLKEVAYFSTPE
ncbi:MAG: hypothetical protein COB30_002780 [Ectothiorhodospiraceae bacterium]|nr:hypothetical protein [Ectothiorhodospiraceae bacterium]